MLEKGKALVAAMGVFLTAGSLFAAFPPMTVELVPGFRIVVNEAEVVSAENQQRGYSDEQLSERIKSLKILVSRLHGDEQAREPKVELLAAYLLLRERGSSRSLKEGEEMLSVIMSRPSIVVYAEPYFQALADATGSVPRKAVEPVRDPETGLILGLLEVDPAETHSELPLGQRLKVTRTFRSVYGDSFSNPDVVYEVKLDAKTSSKDLAVEGPQLAAKNIIEDGKIIPRAWEFYLSPNERFTQGDVWFSAELRRYDKKKQANGVKPPTPENLPMPVPEMTIKKTERPSYISEVLDFLNKLFGAIGAPVAIVLGILNIYQLWGGRKTKESNKQGPDPENKSSRNVDSPGIRHEKRR